MPRTVSMNPDTFYGSGTPPLSGPGTLGAGYFTIFSRKEQEDGEKENAKSPKVFAVIPVSMDSGETTELRLSVAYATSKKGEKQWWPGEDPETPAKPASKDEGPRGPFLLWMDDDKDPRALSGEYDRFAPFMQKLKDAGVPDEVFVAMQETDGLASLDGIKVDFGHEIPEYTRKDDDGKETVVKGQPFNFPLPGSAVMPGEKKSAKANASKKDNKSKADAKAGKAKAGKAADTDDSAQRDTLYERICEQVKEKLGEGEEVTREIASRWVSKIVKESDDLDIPLTTQMPLVLAVKGKGSGEDVDVFEAMMGAMGLTANSSGVFSVEE